MNYKDKMKIIISHYNGMTNDDSGKIPWFDKTSPDIQFFRQQTMSGNKVMIMGRKTYEELGNLHYRTNVILTKHLTSRNTNQIISQPEFIKGACLIGGINAIVSYVTSKVLNKNNCYFFLTEYTYIEKLPATNKKELFSFLNPACNIFEDTFIHKQLGVCKFEVNQYKLNDLY